VAKLFKLMLGAVLAVFAAFLAFFFSFGVSGALWFNLAAGAAGFAAVMWLALRGSRHRLAISLGGAAILLAAVFGLRTVPRLRAAPPADPQDLVGRIGRAAIPLRSVDAGGDPGDLEPLTSIWRGVRMVALGEATHGTSEFFRMKHRLTEFLVTRMGFRYFAMELDPRGGKRVEDYIQGEIQSFPPGTLAWPWKTDEVMSMLRWMRSYNASAPAAARIHFYGIDYQGTRRDFRMARNVLDLLDQLPPESRAVLWAHNAHISTAPGWMGFYLKQALRAQVYLAGFEFHHGRFTSRMNRVHTYDAEPAVNGWYAATLARTGRPIALLDFRSARQDPAIDAWLQTPHLAHDLAEFYGLFRLNPDWVTTNQPWPSLFDGVIYIERSTPTRFSATP
jgi:erythromycin esterase-like protein